MFKKRGHKKLVLFVVLVTTLGFVSAAVADTPPDNRTAEITDESSVWVGAPFVLQAESTDTVSVIEELDQEIGISEGGTTLFGDSGSVKTYETDASINFEYGPDGSHDPTAFADISDEGQIHLVKLEEEDDFWN